MEWTDEGIVLGVRRHGEANAIAELMTVEHGRHLGIVRGGAASRMRPILQPGNNVRVTWRARLDEHLGAYAAEGLRLRAADFLSHAHAVYGVTHVAALCRLLPEREPHSRIYRGLDILLDHLTDRISAAVLIARFELQVLAELGFGLDLERCAATGATADLAYVSPKSGRAVSRTAGEPWRDRLLALPPFLRGEGETPPLNDELSAAFALTGFFLSRHVLEPRGLSLTSARESFIAAAMCEQRAKAAPQND
jgi:DNA repair protein RecO (recombination protein O)